MWTHFLSRAVMPDFPTVYRYIGGIFDPNESNHLQKLKMLDPVDAETVWLFFIFATQHVNLGA